MSYCRCQKLDALYTVLNVFLVAIQYGFFFLKLGHFKIWSIKFLDFVLIFRQRLTQNLSEIEKLKITKENSRFASAKFQFYSHFSPKAYLVSLFHRIINGAVSFLLTNIGTGYTDWNIVNFDYSRLDLGPSPDPLQTPALSNESRLVLNSILNIFFYVLSILRPAL